MIILYGIPNCGTVKKARQWLDAQAIDYTFHDFKKQGIDADTLSRWLTQAGADTLINRKGTTWRSLSESDRAATAEPAGAVRQLQATPSLIKRPVLESDGTLLVGFDAARYAQQFDV